MPYVIDVEGPGQGSVATLNYLMFANLRDAQQFCRLGNLRERHRSCLLFTVRPIADDVIRTVVAPRPSPSPAADRRL